MGGLCLCEYTPLPQTKNITTLKLSGLGQVPTPPSMRRVTASAGRLGRLGQGAGGMREGWQSLTSLGCPIIQGYSGQRQKERLSRSGGGWGSMGLLSPARRVLMGPAPARTGSSRGDKRRPPRTGLAPSAMGHARARRPALPLHGERDSRSIPGPGVPQPTSVPSPTITFPL